MKVFRDSDHMTEVLWYFVPENTPALSFPMAFSDSVWDKRNVEPLGIVGEDPNGHGYSKGLPPPAYAAPGPGFCGSLDQWENGCLTSDPIPADYPASFVPVCCAGVKTLPNGGAAAGKKLFPFPCCPQWSGVPSTVYGTFYHTHGACPALDGATVPFHLIDSSNPCFSAIPDNHLFFRSDAFDFYGTSVRVLIGCADPYNSCTSSTVFILSADCSMQYGTGACDGGTCFGPLEGQWVFNDLLFGAVCPFLVSRYRLEVMP